MLRCMLGFQCYVMQCHDKCMLGFGMKMPCCMLRCMLVYVCVSVYERESLECNVERVFNKITM